jgi:hypothetical protein
MVGDYPQDPINVDLSVFHSVEIPKGSGLNYSDGTTPFVLAKITQVTGDVAYIMETGYRERQGQSPYFNRVMRYEPRPGYFQTDPTINRGRSPALSTDSRTWPDTWADQDHTWDGWWDGYFGKRAAADQESYIVVDDNYYDGWYFYPDSRDSTRHGLGLRVEARGFQWQNPQAGNVLFFHYDIANEGTTDYPRNGSPENIIFGLYMDSGVGGESIGCDGVAESDDDNAYFDRSTGLNLVYTWDKNGHGVSLLGNCTPTGYVGYAYMETPGKPFDGVDNDDDGITDEARDSGPGQLIIGQAAIESYLNTSPKYNRAKFESFYGPLSRRPAYRRGYWWTGDENMDWDVTADDVGADGLPNTHDLGEGDGIPTAGEPHFDKTDKNESDQIGLTGFKMNRITRGIDDVIFYMDGKKNWPLRLWDLWTSPALSARFDTAVVENLNIGFLFASGPFTLKAGLKERFSFAFAYGATLGELRTTVKAVQQIYNGNYTFAIPPPTPTLTAEAGDHYVQLTWDDVAEHSTNPVIGTNVFEGYRIYRSTDPDFLDPRVIVSGQGTSTVTNGRPIAQFDLVDTIQGYSQVTVEGIAYWLGSETGITHLYRDTSVNNGQQYYYAVCAYDYGPSILQQSGDQFTFFPSENPITVSRTPRGGLILPKNTVSVRPNPKVLGYTAADVSQATRVSGEGTGSVSVKVLDSKLVPDGHLFKLSFNALPVNIHADTYSLTDSTSGTLLFKTGDDFDGAGTGISGAGIQPIVTTLKQVTVDSIRSGFAAGSVTNATLSVQYVGDVFPINLRRDGYPDDITITFSNTYLDTSVASFPLRAKPAKFRIVAHTVNGDKRLPFKFFDLDNDGSLSFYSVGTNEFIEILTGPDSLLPRQRVTWHIELNKPDATTRPPSQGDVYNLKLLKPFGVGDVFTFTTKGEKVSDATAKQEFKNAPYVVPNPYVGAVSFEPQRFAINGRGERRLEFRGLPQTCTIRIYTVRGDLVQTLFHDNSTDGYVPWNLRTKDNLDVAPGLYIYHVDGGSAGTFVGKFAVIK